MDALRKSERLPAVVGEHLLGVALVLGLLIVALPWLREQQLVDASSRGDASAATLAAPAPLTVLPDMSLARSTDERKRMFLDYVGDYVDAQNHSIILDRQRLQAVIASVDDGGIAAVGGSANETQEWLRELAGRYDLAEADFADRSASLNELLMRVDVVPVSLVLAQAANESAWGVSRFAREGNNLFGQWCFRPGCGIVPLQRPAGAIYEVRRFATLHDAVEAYFHNLNTNESYRPFRELRQAMKLQGREIDPLVLAFGLNRYSERGRSYVDELQTIIVQNDLTARDGDYEAVGENSIGMSD